MAPTHELDPPHQLAIEKMSCRHAYKPGDGDDSSIVALSSQVTLVIVTLTGTIQHSWWSDPASQISEGTLGGTVLVC